MIRFRNPGTQYNTQIQVFKELYKEYKDEKSFDLEDMANTIAKCNLMTAYGYSGDNALSLSDTQDTSRNSTLMNAKMYAEVFRLLGWISSEQDKKSYPLVFTYIGEHVAVAENVLPLYEQCVLGINNPQEIMRVKYTENVRFLKTALLTMLDLGGIIYKHELCLGPMSIDDLDRIQYSSMIQYLKSLRGDYNNLTRAYQDLCNRLNVKPALPDNSTRLPIAFMKTCGWVEKVHNKTIYPPKSLEYLKITEHGSEIAESLKEKKDLRLNEFNRYNNQQQESLIRLGVFYMLKRAGYDISPVIDTVNEDEKICEKILDGRELLFSPYQTLKCDKIEKALGIERTFSAVSSTSKEVTNSVEQAELTIKQLALTQSVSPNSGNDKEINRFVDEINMLREEGLNSIQIAKCIFESRITDTQTRFYPFVAMLFRVIGLDCLISRAGDNGSRWDAMIKDPIRSIPIEIKSPTEELYLSLKALRQALENKIILLSRETYSTDSETTTLVVCYNLPNERSEVSRLINDIKKVYGFKIGIFDLYTLLKIAVSIVVDNKSFDVEELYGLEGYADAIIE